MNYKEKDKKLIKLDYVIVILSILGLVVFSILFLHVYDYMRFVFLGFSIYAFITLFTSLKEISNYKNTKKIKKYSGKKIRLFTSKRKVKKVA